MAAEDGLGGLILRRVSRGESGGSVDWTRCWPMSAWVRMRLFTVGRQASAGRFSCRPGLWPGGVLNRLMGGWKRGTPAFATASARRARSETGPSSVCNSLAKRLSSFSSKSVLIPFWDGLYRWLILEEVSRGERGAAEKREKESCLLWVASCWRARLPPSLRFGETRWRAERMGWRMSGIVVGPSAEITNRTCSGTVARLRRASPSKGWGAIGG